MNEDLSETRTEGYFELNGLRLGRVTFWVNQSHPSPNRPHHHNRLASLWLSCPRQLTCLPLMKTIMLQADGLQCECACEHTTGQDVGRNGIFLKWTQTRTIRSWSAAWSNFHLYSHVFSSDSACSWSLPKQWHFGCAAPKSLLSALSGKGDVPSLTQ